MVWGLSSPVPLAEGSWEGGVDHGLDEDQAHTHVMGRGAGPLPLQFHSCAVTNIRNADGTCLVYDLGLCRLLMLARACASTAGGWVHDGLARNRIADGLRSARPMTSIAPGGLPGLRFVGYEGAETSKADAG